jgi:hypothetical protein
MLVPHCKKILEIRASNGETLRVICGILRKRELEKKYPHKSHIGSVSGTKGEEAQVLWKDETKPEPEPEAGERGEEA